MSARGIEAVLTAHEPGEDWHCTCGEDLFGGTAAYGLALHRAHVADAIRAHLLSDEVVEQVGRVMWSRRLLLGADATDAEAENEARTILTAATEGDA